MHTHRFPHGDHPRLLRQRGAVLIVSLMILVVLTLIGITAMRATMLQEQMAGNLRDQNTALLAAEAALRDGAALVENLVHTNGFGDGGSGSPGLIGEDYDTPSDNELFNSSSWTAANSRVFAGTTLPGVAAQPRYKIKADSIVAGNNKSLTFGKGSRFGDYGSQNTSTNDVTMFRVIGRGTGTSSQSQVVIESYYGKIL